MRHLTLPRWTAAIVLSVQGTGGAVAQDVPGPVSSALEEIVVTARKREERLQETPISITAMSGEALADRRIETTQELARVVPNLIVSQGQSVSGNSSAGAYFIRGIGQIDFLLNTDPGVGLYVDGVYVARSVGSILDLIDVERVEVLRGPQGTLFGRNTIGGAISVVSKPPSDNASAEVRGTLGSFDLRDARLTFNGPITEGLDGKIAALWRERDGWVDGVTDGSTLGDDRSVAARGALRWEPTNKLLFDLAVDYVDQDGTSPPANVVQVVETAAFPGFTTEHWSGRHACHRPDRRPIRGVSIRNGKLVICSREQGTFDSKQELEVVGASLIGESQVTPELTLRSITGYRETDALGNRDGDHTPVLIQTTTDTWTHDQFSEELQFVGVRHSTSG